MRVRIVGVAVLLSGCSSELVAPLELDDATETVVFRRAACGEERATVFVSTPDLLDFDFPYCLGLEVALHEYDELPAALCLPTGILEAGDGAGVLPVPDHAREGALSAEGIAWSELAEGQSSIADPVVSPPDVVACAENGRCFGDATACDCHVTCDAPEVSGSNAPTPPQAVCPTGWTVDTPRLGIEACRAFAGAPDCTLPEVAIPGAGCVALARACSGDVWPAVTADLYVSAGAGGLGTVSDPFGDLAMAVDVAAPGQVIAVAAGRYVFPPFVDVDDLTIVGVCPGAVTLEVQGRIGVRSSGFALRDVTLALATDVFSVQETGSATFSGVVVEGPNELDLRGDTLIERSIFHTAPRVVANAEVRDSRLFAGLRVRGGRVITQRVAITNDGGVPVIGIDGLQVELQQTWVASSERAIDVTVGGALHIVDSEILGSIQAFTDTATIASSYVAPGPEGVTLGRCIDDVQSRVALSDVVAVGSGDEEPTITIGCTAPSLLQRMAVIGGQGLWFRAAEIEADDVRVFDSAENGVTLVGASVAGFHRLHISGSNRVGLAVDDNLPGDGLQGGLLSFTDVVVEGSGEAAARFDDTNVVVVERGAFLDSAGEGFVLAPNSVAPSRLTLHNVRVDGARGEAVCGGALSAPCNGVGIYIYAELGVGDVAVQMVDVESANATMAFRVRGIVDLALDRVLVRDSVIGTYVNAPTIPRRRFVTGVRYVGNETALEFVQ